MLLRDAVLILLGKFVYRMGRCHYDGAERCVTAIIQSTPVDGYAKETGCSQGLNAGFDLLQVTAKTFFAVVHAESDLRAGSGHADTLACAPAATAPVLCYRIKNLFAVVALISL